MCFYIRTQFADFHLRKGLFSPFYAFFKENKAIRNSYKTSMESAIGYQLTDDEFEALWERQYANMRNASDYAHYNITSAAIIATDYPPSGWDFIEWAKRRLANAYTGGSDTSREDMAGWLGDATIKTDSESHVSFTQDDYKADLDAENVTNLMKVRGISYHEAEKIYFDMLNGGESRATIFLSHTPLNYVIDAILSKLNVDSLAELKIVEPDAYNFILNLEYGSNELEDLK